MNDHDELVISKRIASGPLSSEEALQYATGLAQALRRMHQEGAVCGSLHPDRVVLGARGVRLAPGNPGLTPYTSPEQVLGEDVDARSDVFAFGAIAYELLSGRKAFPALTTEELKKQILEQEPAPLTGVSQDTTRLVGRCLEKKRENRWQRMSAILIELKLAGATSRYAQQASEWKEKMASLRTQIAAGEATDFELRHSVVQLEEKTNHHDTQISGVLEALATLQESVAGLQKGALIHSRSIESIEAAIAQTDEVVEHVVDAFGLTHKPAVERAEAILSVSRNGS